MKLLRFIFWLTGGRPMKRSRWARFFDFTDMVSGHRTTLWEDRYRGRIWMAEGPWSLFRIESRFNDKRVRDLLSEPGVREAIESEFGVSSTPEGVNHDQQTGRQDL